MALSSATVPESDILRKGETPGGKKKETFDGFSDIFGSGDLKISNDKPSDFFALYCGREFFNCTFTWENLANEAKEIYYKISGRNIVPMECKLQLLVGEKFGSMDSCFYRYFHRFFKSPGRLFLDGLTFLLFSKRLFLGMDTLAEYSFFLKRKLFFTLRIGWDYNDFAFKYGEDIEQVDFKDALPGKYAFDSMSTKQALNFCEGDEASFVNKKEKEDLKYCNEFASVQDKNNKFRDKKNEIFETGDEVFVFTSLYKYFLDFGLSYYSNPRDPAESFVFRILLKLNAFYNVTCIDYVKASSLGVISNFSVDDVINKYVSSPALGCKVCLCFGYKNWEAEISIALYSNYKENDKCSGMFYSESLQKRLPVSIAIRNRFIGL